jgi:putative endonuclease
MTRSGRAPAGPRGAIGAAAEQTAADHLQELGWVVLARNVRVGEQEIDIVALERGPPRTLVIVEVRSRSGPNFGAAVESVDARKVARLYGAAMRLRRNGHAALADGTLWLPWRVDLLTLRREGRGGWHIEDHLRGLAPP